MVACATAYHSLTTHGQARAPDADGAAQQPRGSCIRPSRAGVAGRHLAPTRSASALGIAITELGRAVDAQPRFAIELREAEIGNVFRVLAHDYQLNLLIDEQVRGTVTASLTNVSLQEALEAIAAMKHLTLKHQGTIIKVARNLVTRTFQLKHVEAAALLGASPAPNTIQDLSSPDGKILLGQQPNSIMVIDYPEMVDQIEAFLAVADQRMASQVFRLKYLIAAELVGHTPASASASEERAADGVESPTGSQILSLLSSQGQVFFGNEPNSILVIDHPEHLRRVTELIELLDVPASQVAIEARVVEVKLQGEHALGVNWTLLSEDEGAKLGPVRFFSSASSPNRGSVQQSIPFKPTFFPPSASSGQETPFSLTIFHDNLSVILQTLANALETDILSAPRITTRNNQEAEIRVIRQLPWAEPTVTTTGSGSTASVQVTWDINFEEVGILLNVTPTINDDNMIAMTLKPEVSEHVSDFSLSLVTGTGANDRINYTVPVIDRRVAATKVLIGNRQTLIIGGLIKTKRTDGASKIPGVGDWPLVGSLFRSTKDTVDKSELLIFVSPTIITPDELTRHAREERFGVGRKATLEREAHERAMDQRETEAQAARERAQHRALQEARHRAREDAEVPQPVDGRVFEALKARQQVLFHERMALEKAVEAQETKLHQLQSLDQQLLQQQPQPLDDSTALPRQPTTLPR